MSRRGDRMVARARALVGTRFRPQGRDPRHGLDCAGMAAAAAGLPAGRVRRDYPLRGHSLAGIAADLAALGCVPVRPAEREPGDVIVCAVGPAQFHLLLDAGASVLHADAALRRVVERPLPLPWPVAGIWRLAAGDDEEEQG